MVCPIWVTTVTGSPVSKSHKYEGKQGPPSWSKHWGPLSREGALSMICGFKECLICLEEQPAPSGTSCSPGTSEPPTLPPGGSWKPQPSLRNAEWPLY